MCFQVRCLVQVGKGLFCWDFAFCVSGIPSTQILVSDCRVPMGTRFPSTKAEEVPPHEYKGQEKGSQSD